MTDQQINQAIFKVCLPLEGDYGQASPLDYCADLNAMAEAEAWLSLTDRNHYIDALGGMFGGSWEFAAATARQRAEAFLRTLGKWEPTDKDSLTVGATTEESSLDHLREVTKKMKEGQR